MKVDKKQVAKVRQDIRDYEHHKNMKHLSTGAMLATAIGAGVAGFHGDKKLMTAGAASSFASGFARGRAKREEQSALQRVKNFYDLRKIQYDAKQSDKHEKVAVLISATHAALHAVAPEVANMFPPEAVAGADIALLPKLTEWVKNKNIDHSRAAIKNRVGKTLTGKDKDLLAGSMKVQSNLQRLDEATSRLNPSNPLSFGVIKLKDYAKNFLKLGPSYFGGEAGELAGPIVKEIDKISPRHADKIIDGLERGGDFSSLGGELKQDYKYVQRAGKVLSNTAKKVGLTDVSSNTADTLMRTARTVADRPAHLVTMAKKIDNYATKGVEAAKIMDSTIDEIPFLRKFLNMTGRSGSGLAQKLKDNPQLAVDMAQNFKHTVQKSVRASKVGIGALALAGLGHAAGSYRKRHALASDALPKKIMTPEDAQAEQTQKRQPRRAV